MCPNCNYNYLKIELIKIFTNKALLLLIFKKFPYFTYLKLFNSDFNLCLSALRTACLLKKCF